MMSEILNIHIWVESDPKEGPWFVVRQRGLSRERIGPLMTEGAAFAEMGDIINQAARLNQSIPESPREVYHPSYERRG